MSIDDLNRCVTLATTAAPSLQDDVDLLIGKRTLTFQISHKVLNLPFPICIPDNYNYLPSGSKGKTHCLHEIHLPPFISLTSLRGSYMNSIIQTSAFSP